MLRKNRKKTYSTTEWNLYTNLKDRIDKLATSYIVYKFYKTVRTERTLIERINEHAFQASNNHIHYCDGEKYLVYVLNIDQVQTKRDKFEKKIYRLATNRARRWGILF